MAVTSVGGAGNALLVAVALGGGVSAGISVGIAVGFGGLRVGV